MITAAAKSPFDRPGKSAAGAATGRDRLNNRLPCSCTLATYTAPLHVAEYESSIDEEFGF